MPVLLKSDALWSEEHGGNLSEANQSYVSSQQNVEVYVDDMLVKSLVVKEHLNDL